MPPSDGHVARSFLAPEPRLPRDRGHRMPSATGTPFTKGIHPFVKDLLTQGEHKPVCIFVMDLAVIIEKCGAKVHSENRTYGPTGDTF